MSMEKYGVADKAAQQRQELAQVRAKLGAARSGEKTAAAQETILALEARERELRQALTDQ
jgi:hypothetical protein